jgi:hypothetical protein
MMNMKTHPNEIAGMISEASTCEKLIALFDEKRTGLSYKEWTKQKQIRTLEHKVETTSARIQRVSDELIRIKELQEGQDDQLKEELKYMRMRIEQNLLHLKEEYKSARPDSLALPLFELNLVTAQRQSFETFVDVLQRRLKKLSSAKTKRPSDKPSTARRRPKKAA